MTSRSVLPFIRDAIGALLLAALVVVGAGYGWQALRGATAPTADAVVGDRITDAIATFDAGRHVHVAADAHDMISAEQVSELEEAAAASPNPVYIALWEYSTDSGFGGIWNGLRQLQRTADRDGVYVLWNGPGHGLVDYRSETTRISPAPELDEHGEAFRRLSEVVAQVRGAEVTTRSTSDYWGGKGGAIAAGLLFACGAIPATLLLIGTGRVAAGRRFRMRGGWW